MAFNFLGTFTQTEVNDLLDFARDQLQDTQDKIAFLQGELQRTGWIEYEIGPEGVPVSYTITPTGSQLDSLVKSFQFYGGNLLDLSIRSRGQWLSFARAEANLDSQEDYPAGQLEAANGGAEPKQRENLHKDDAVPAEVVKRVKSSIVPAIKAKREKYEFQIKKAIDLSDQYLEEILLLTQRETGSETLDELETKIRYFLSNSEFHSADPNG